MLASKDRIKNIVRECVSEVIAEEVDKALSNVMGPSHYISGPLTTRSRLETSLKVAWTERVLSALLDYLDLTTQVEPAKPERVTIRRMAKV